MIGNHLRLWRTGRAVGRHGAGAGGDDERARSHLDPLLRPGDAGRDGPLTVVIGDEAIGSPLVRYPDYVIAMNAPSVDKYEPCQKRGHPPGRQRAPESPLPARRLRAIAMPAHDIAVRLADQRLVNMTMIGGLIGLTDLLPLAAAEAALAVELPERHQHLLAANVEALHAGAAWVAALK